MEVVLDEVWSKVDDAFNAIRGGCKNSRQGHSFSACNGVLSSSTLLIEEISDLCTTQSFLSRLLTH